MADTVIELQHVRRSFGANRVLSDVSLRLSPQTVFGLVGLNGAGKTTLIRIMLGLLKADDGECRVLGCDPWQHKSDYYRQLGVVLEHNGFWGNLTARQNLSFFAEARGVCERVLEQYLEAHWTGTFLPEKSQKVKYFSRGEKMQCALCRAFLGRSRAYFLDEPVVALDVKAYDHFCSLVKHAREEGATVLISSHQLDAIEDLCDSVGILEDGKLTLLDEPGVQRWLIRAEDKPEYGAAIKELSRGEAVYADGAWRFEVDERGKQAVSAIVSRLVGMGCTVEEVRRERSGIRESIRRHYGASETR